MKLLFDENVSHRLTQTLADLFPGSSHVRTVGLHGTEDWHVWEYAQKEGFLIVSKDTDFRERSYVEGAPPKVVWLDVGNAGTKAIEQLLRREYGAKAKDRVSPSQPKGSASLAPTSAISNMAHGR